jgi:cytochrome c-type biogenesis protein CcmH
VSADAGLKALGRAPDSTRPSTSLGRPTARRAALALVSSRPAWALLVVAAIVALGVGSVHPRAQSATSRIAYLDSVIKCPSCVDLSISQSDAPIAAALRADVAAWVREGLSDGRIENLVVARFGEGVLLVPTGSGADALLWAVPAALIGGAALLLAFHLWSHRRVEATR